MSNEEQEIQEQDEEVKQYEVGTKVFSEDVNDDLLCPSQIYEYVELISDDRVRFVGYNDYDTYEEDVDQSMLDKLFASIEEDDADFEEKKASRLFL